MGIDSNFNKVLIANRGEIALRVLRCLQSMSIASVAIYHEADSASPVVRLADEAVEIFGDSPSAAHLDIEKIVVLCQQMGVDAVHPCYGFLSENAQFARALEAAGIRFIGPSPEVIELMGDKITSRDFVERYGFPVPPSVTMEAGAPEFLSAIERMTFPLVVKASAGGGGKGMSIVQSMDELEATLRVASSEAEKYFGDKRVYVERYFEGARHIEVQVLGDGTDVVHLGERECSVQRRFQKIIEEAPAPGLSEEKRQSICEAAVGIAKAANYSSVGTVEFLYTPEGEFFFLEMNTRIQVEHPVTEMVYAVDLVAEQIKVAAGGKLTLRQGDVVMSGHAIECRVCAEDAFNDFMPETGSVLYLREPSGEGVRFDSSLYQGQKVTTAFDPMLAKLIVHGSTREQAIVSAIKGLRELVLLGVQTNTQYLINVLEHSAFINANIDTDFVKTHAQDLQEQAATKEQLQAVLTAALLSDRNTKLLFEATPEIYSAIGRWRN
jgi:pyruvate carboxylase subunit A